MRIFKPRTSTTIVGRRVKSRRTATAWFRNKQTPEVPAPRNMPVSQRDRQLF